MNKNIEVLQNNNYGYTPLVDFEKWRVAGLNHFEVVDIESLERVERHLFTDEVFILTEGKAFLIVEKDNNDGECFDTIKMNKNIVYNVKKGKWHHIVMEKDASVIIIENSNTNLDNTEYKSIIETEIIKIKSVIFGVEI
ncbi:MAG: hypothetical protein ACLFRY_01030 [Spirochaetia bacterium]